MDLSKVEFKNEKRFLSNMWPCSIKFGEPGEPSPIPDVDCDGKIYKSSEHFYQAMKSKSSNWHDYLNTLSPEGTKKEARNKLKTLIANDKTTFMFRDDWDEVKLIVMKYIVQQKFIQNPHLMTKLKSIDGHIEERNCWGDTFWGTVDGYGDNHLGSILMDVRDNS